VFVGSLNPINTGLLYGFATFFYPIMQNLGAKPACSYLPEIASIFLFFFVAQRLLSSLSKN